MKKKASSLFLLDLPASWCSPDRRVGCSKRGWSPARTLPPAHQAGHTPPCAARMRVLPSGKPVHRFRMPGSSLRPAVDACFLGPQHLEAPGSTALPLPAFNSLLCASSFRNSIWRLPVCGFKKIKEKYVRIFFLRRQINKYTHDRFLNIVRNI